MLGLLFTKFDENSYSCLFYHNIEEDFVNKICDKILTTISQGALRQKENNVSSAIIPLPELKLVSYIYLIKVSNTLFSLNYELDSNSQLKLYRCIPLLERISKDFFKEIENKILISGNSLDQDISVKNSFSNLDSTAHEIINLDLEQVTNSSYTLQPLIELLGNGVSSLFRAMLLNDKVVIFCEKDKNILSYPWKQFFPHKTLDIVAYPENPRSITSFDIMIVEPSRKKECDANCVILDLVNNKFENGKQDKYIENFIKYIQNLESDLFLEINIEVDNIFNWVNEIIEVSTKEKDDKKIKNLIEFHSKTRFGNRLPLVTAIARKYNEFTADRISTYFLKELGIFNKDVTRVDTQKLLTKL